MNVTSVILSRKILCSGHKTPFTFRVPYEVSSCRREQEVTVHSASSSIHTQLLKQAYTLHNKEIAVRTEKTIIDMNSCFLVLQFQGLQKDDQDYEDYKVYKDYSKDYEVYKDYSKDYKVYEVYGLRIMRITSITCLLSS